MTPWCANDVRASFLRAQLPARVSVGGGRSLRPSQPAVLRRCPTPVRAASSPEKDSATKQEGVLSVPDTPPAAGATPPRTPEAEAGAAQSTQDGSLSSVDDIQLRAAQLRAAQLGQQQAKEGWWQGVLEEVVLIKWPTPKQAILNTLLVITIVGGTSAMLFAVNTLLAELSRKIYG